MEIDLRKFRIADSAIVRTKPNSDARRDREPRAPQIFWIAGISLLLLAEALILGGLASVSADLRGAGQLAARSARAQLRAR